MQPSEELRVILRHFDPDTDQGAIYATWRNSLFYSSDRKKKFAAGSAADGWFKRQTALIRDTLRGAKVKIACLEYDPLTIIGYSVATGSHLDFIYVKIEYRNQGIAKLLMPKNIETVTPDLTEIGAAIAKKKKLKIKGEQNVSTPESSGS
jgi:ribosomal protein S18 acetylase RimI-like enzyme